MDYRAISKRRLYSALSWATIVLWLLFNLSMAVSGVPFMVTLIIVPIINILFIATWVLMRTFYNVHDAKIKHDKKMELYTEGRPTPRYGEGKGEAYIPNLTVDAELFKRIGAEAKRPIILDVSLRDYLKPGRVIIFHNEVDYGSWKKVEVIDAKQEEKEMTVFFKQLLQ